IIAAVTLLPGCLLAASAAEPGPWRVLFDGHDASAWRGFGQKEFPKDKWMVEDGCLHLLKNPQQGGELVTIEKFDNFEFQGEWNQSRLVVQGNHVEHWLNGVKVLSYEVGSAEVKAALAQSKFKDVPGFGDKIKGHILLTNHQSDTWFRKMRLRELPAEGVGK